MACRLLSHSSSWGASGGGGGWRDERCCSADAGKDSLLGRLFRCPFGGRGKADEAGVVGSDSRVLRTREWDAVGFGDAAHLRI